MKASDSDRLGPRARSLADFLFPRGVRIVHFIVVPALGMALALGSFYLIDRIVEPTIAPVAVEVYRTIRAVVIAAIMTSLIAFLAAEYRSAYETQLRARNEDLEATRDFLAQVIESSGEAIITRDAAGRVTSWNRSAEEIYGWSAREMMGNDVGRLVPDDPEARAGLAHVEAAMLRGETVHHFSTTRIRKGGKPIAVAITASPLYDRAGRRAGSMAIVRDLTSLKEMEARLMEREMLAAVGEMAAILAHEVRNPLAGIRGGCELLLEGYAHADPHAEIGREVIHQVDRLNGIVQDLLTFARPKAADPVPTDLHPLLDRVLTVLQEDPANRAVEIRRLYGSESLVVRVDPRQMEQVFLNLLLNACQAMGRAGTLTLSSASNVETVEVVVHDSGPGIPADKIEQIFRPFFTTRVHGTGLGLAICKKIVEAHDGRIEAKSPPGGGAQFTVILPRGD